MASTTNKQPLANKKKKSKKPSSSSSSSSSSSFPTMTTPVVGSSSASSSKSQKKSKSQQPRAQHASTTTTTTPATMSTSSISDSEDESTTPSTTTTKSSSSSVPFSTSTAAVNKLKTMFANKTNRSLIKILPSSSSRMDQYPSTQQSQQKVSSASTTTNKKKKKKNGHPATSSSSTAKKTTKKTKTSEAYDGEEEEYDYDDEEEEEEEYDGGNEEEEDDENNDDDDDDDSENEEDNVNSATSTAPAASSSSLTTTTTTTTITSSNTSDTMVDSANGNSSGSSGSSGVGSSSSHSADKSQLVMIRCACCGQQVSLESAPFHVDNELLKEWYLKVFPHVAAKRDDRACNKCYRKVSRMRKADPEAAEASAAATAAASAPSTAPASNSAPSTVDSQAASAGNTVKATPPKSKKSSSQSTSNSGSKRPRDSPGIDTFFPKKPKVTTVQESPVPAARSSVPSHAQATTIETAVLIPDSDEVMECPQTPGEPTEVEVISDTANDSSVITTNAITVAPDRLIRTDILLEFRRQAAPTNDYVHMVPIFNASPSLPDFINVIQEAWRGLPKRAGDTENFSFIRLQRAVKDFSGEIAYVDMLNSNVFEIYPIRQLEKFVVLQPALES